MLKNPFTSFGFSPGRTEARSLDEIQLGPKEEKKKIFWTLLIYIFFTAGIFLGRTVNQYNPTLGINVALFTGSVIGASFIVGFGFLAPLLRMLSRFHKGQLSWQHCLTAFSIGFFAKLTFGYLIDAFIGILK